MRFFRCRRKKQPFFLSFSLKPNLLLNDPSCPQLKNLCSNLLANSEDLLVLECIATFQSDYDLSIDETCQHTVYLRKSELMNDNNIHKLLEKSCSKDLLSLNSLCHIDLSTTSTEFSGKYLSCVLDNRDTIKGDYLNFPTRQNFIIYFSILCFVRSNL